MCDPCQPICFSPSCDPYCSVKVCCEPRPAPTQICCDPCVKVCCPPKHKPRFVPRCDPCCPPKRCKSRELRSSVLMKNCDCVKRNGLQMDCPRMECKGRSCCTIKPWPLCCPSKYTWRYTNVTMGKPSKPKTTANVPKSKPCETDFNPCVKSMPFDANCDPCVKEEPYDFCNDDC